MFQIGQDGVLWVASELHGEFLLYHGEDQPVLKLMMPSTPMVLVPLENYIPPSMRYATGEFDA